MTKKKRAIIISIVLFVVSLVWIFIAFFVPGIVDADSFNHDNTFKHSATVEYTEVTKDAFQIHIQENEQILGISMDFLKGKTELLREIHNGDAIVFWTYFGDVYDLPNVDNVPTCAFSINDKPILTIEESNRVLQESYINVKILVIVVAVILISIGVFLLVRSYRKPKDNINQNPQT